MVRLDPQVEHCRRRSIGVLSSCPSRQRFPGRERVPVSSFCKEICTAAVSTRHPVPGSYAFGPFSLGREIVGPTGAAYFNFLTKQAAVPSSFLSHQGMFQRFAASAASAGDHENAYRDMGVQWVSKDLGRTIDYLETRADIERREGGLLRPQLQHQRGAAYVAVEPRFPAVVLSGTPWLGVLPKPNPNDFASHITAPTLMLNGRDDFIFPLDTVARRLFSAARRACRPQTARRP